MSTKLAKMVADFRTSLATEIAVGGTGATLQSYVDSDGVTVPDGTYYLSLDIENSKKEHVFATMASGVLSSIYTVSRQGVRTSGVLRKHRIGASVVMTDFAHIMFMNDLLRGITALDATAPLQYDAVPTLTLDAQLATVKFVNDTAIAGAAVGSNGTPGIFLKATTVETIAGTDTDGTYTYVIPVGLTKATTAGAGDSGKIPLLDTAGLLASAFIDYARTWATVQSFTANNLQITTDADSANDAVRYSQIPSLVNAGAITATSGEAITAGQGVYVKASDSKIYKTVATGDESTFSFVGIASTTVAGADLDVSYIPPGHVLTTTGLTSGAQYFITDVAGTLGVAQGTRFARVGRALSTTKMLVLQPKFIVSGIATISATGNTTITTGFWPARITVNAGPTASGGDGNGCSSVGDDTNKCFTLARFSAGVDSQYISNRAWYNYNVNTSTLRCAGTIDTKTQTGFNFNTATFNASGHTNLLYTAFSE